ncbi:MAG: polyprenyl synthetase family protein [Gammaproteobacteria bacterium]|nr:polyprenyl synthetase family protein [Gammaproteobacteria bacterium]
MKDYTQWEESHKSLIEEKLNQVLWEFPNNLPFSEALRYAVLSGGKRLRGLLVLAIYCSAQGIEAVDAHSYALRCAAVVELIHTYSLVHDDLPCMDNDILRRGKPTVHVQFGEASAVLVGDALQALAFLVLCGDSEHSRASPVVKLGCLQALLGGAVGMVLGQYLDITNQLYYADPRDQGIQAQLETINRHKTADLFVSSAQMGVLCSDFSDKIDLLQVKQFALNLGQAFQLVDDVLDFTSKDSVLGKSAGKDKLVNKLTLGGYLGDQQGFALADKLITEAIAHLPKMGTTHIHLLVALAYQMIQRQF